MGKQKREKENLFDDSDSGSDSFTSTSQDTSLPLPAGRGAGPDPLASDTLGLLVEGGGGKVEGEGVGLLRLSESSDEESAGRMRMTSRGQASSFLSTAHPSQSERLLQQCSQVCLKCLDSALLSCCDLHTHPVFSVRSLQLGAENKQLKEELDKFKEKFRKEKQKYIQLLCLYWWAKHVYVGGVYMS